MTHLAARVLLIALVAGSLVVYGDLPASIPTHFDALGRADAWGERSLLGWMLLPAVGILVIGITGWARRRARSHPGIVNLPDKAAFLDLPPASRDRVLDEMDAVLGWVELGAVVLLCVIQVARLRTATGGDASTLLSVTLVATLLASPLLVVVLLVRLQRAVSRERERVRDGAARGDTGRGPSETPP